MEYEEFEYAGRQFAFRLVPDEDMPPPWENEDGHGPVSEWERRDKMPGEMVLSGDGRGRLGTDCARRFYDFAEACRIARRDGWGFLPGRLEITTEDAGKAPCEKRGGRARVLAERGGAVLFEAADSEDVNRAIAAVYAAHRATMTARQYAAGAALADFKRLQAWCNDSWCYVGVEVAPCDPEDGPDWHDSQSLWGIESDSPDYHRDVAEELAGEF